MWFDQMWTKCGSILLSVFIYIKGENWSDKLNCTSFLRMATLGGSEEKVHSYFLVISENVLLLVSYASGRIGN